MRDRRDARAWLQCLRHRPCLELIRPAPAKLPRRTHKAVGNSFDHRKVLVPELGADIEALSSSSCPLPIPDRSPLPPDGVCLPLTSGDLPRLVVATPTLEQDQHCIAALHKERFPNDQKTITMHIVDAHGGFLPVPLQQLFPSGGSYLQNSWAAVFRRPFFLFLGFGCGKAASPTHSLWLKRLSVSASFRRSCRGSLASLS